MRKTGGIVLGLAVLAVMPAAAQETEVRETVLEHETAQERETVLDLLGLLADARTGAGWTAVAGGTGASATPAAAPPPGSDATSAEPPVGGGRPR